MNGRSSGRSCSDELPSDHRWNSARLGKLIFKDGVVVLRSLFNRFHAPSTLPAVLRSNHGILRSLLEKELLSPAEWKLLFPDDASLPSSLNMEPHLLFLLFQNICDLPEPSAGWNSPPSSSCDSNQLQEKLAKLKWLVNEVASRASSSGVKPVHFSFYWNEIFHTLKSLGVNFPYSSEELKHRPLNEAGKDKYHKLLVDWAAKESEMKNQDRVLNITSVGHENIESLKSVLQDQEKIKRELWQQVSLRGVMPFNWDKSCIIGEGCKGTKVYRGHLTSNGKEVAVKKMYLGVFDKAEAEKLRRCKHPNIIRCFDTYEEEDFFYLALELCKKTLKMCVDENEFDSLCGDLSLEKCFLQVTSGVVYLHESKICHRDIKPDNILLVAKNDEYSYQRFVLADFNCARDVPSGETFSTQHSTVGTPGWMAPEMCLFGKRRTLKVDIFSLGCVFYYTLTNKKHPYGDLDNTDECQKNISTRRIPVFSVQDFEKNTSFIELIEKMVHPDADRRLSASEVYSVLILKLGMREVLKENIMHDCVVKLLRSTDEESYECLCKLLTRIGKDLDHEKAKPRVDQYFEQIKKIVQARRTSSRVRFMMIDVLDLRKNNWVSRREDNNPKKTL